MTPTPEGKQLAADLANAGRVTRPEGEPSLLTGACIVLAGPVIGLACNLLGLWL